MDGIDVEDILHALPPEGRAEFIDKLKRENGVEIPSALVELSKRRREYTAETDVIKDIEKRVEKIERILLKLPKDIREALDVLEEEPSLTGEDEIRVINQLRAVGEKRGIKIHHKIKLSSVVLSIINQNYMCLKLDNPGLACPCDDPLAHGCNFFIPLESEIQVLGMLQESCTR